MDWRTLGQRKRERRTSENVQAKRAIRRILNEGVHVRNWWELGKDYIYHEGRTYISGDVFLDELARVGVIYPTISEMGRALADEQVTKKSVQVTDRASDGAIMTVRNRMYYLVSVGS